MKERIFTGKSMRSHGLNRDPFAVPRRRVDWPDCRIPTRRGVLALCLMLVLAFVLSGCSLGTRVQGRKLLGKGSYEQGIERFTEKVAANPDDPVANYFLGRFLLAEERFKPAHEHLLKATRIDPKKPDYFFWLGVAQWSLGRFDQERESYLTVLNLDPDYLQARVYLGHNYLDRKEYPMALEQYSKALDLSDKHPEALYNKALTLGKLGLSEESRSTYKEYLKHYPDGVLGRSAIQFLNERGDFTYRLHALGIRKVPLEWIQFEPGTARLRPEAYPSLRTIGAFLTQNTANRLIIQSFCKGDTALASQRGNEIKEFLLRGYPSVDAGRLEVQAHGRPERVQTGDKIYALDRSIVFKTSR